VIKFFHKFSVPIILKLCGFLKKIPSIYFFGAVCCLNFVDFQKICRNFVADVNKPDSRHGEQEAARGSRVYHHHQQEADIGALGSC
jgi:hypothetical protein